MKFQYKEQYKYLSSVCLNLTDSCNLACRYCFVKQQPHFMTLDIAKQAVDFLINNLHWKKDNNYSNNNEVVKLTYFGGEPTLLWDEIIVPLTLYAEEKYPNEVQFAITTNGTLLNKERIDFLFNHKINPLLSIDGAKKTQDYNRPCKNENESSFNLVLKNIPYLLKKFPYTTFRATINQDTAAYTFENYLFAITQGFQAIYMTPNSREKWTKKNQEILKNELQKIYWFFANYLEKNKEAPINFPIISNSFKHILEHDIKIYNNDPEKEIIKQRQVLRCGLGTTFGSIGYDGSIYGCQEQDSKIEKNIFYLGNIFTGINVEKHKQLLQLYNQKAKYECENKDLCKQCKIRNICNEMACPSSSWDQFQSFFIDSEIHCLWNQYAFDNAIVVMDYFVRNNNQYFNTYLNEFCNFKQYFNQEVVNSG